MKRTLMILFAAALTVVVAATSFAAGGKVRGDEGKGPVYQVQVMDPPPFQ